jgi:hypothetical protein
VRYTTVNLYQSVPTTCNQPVPIACNQPVPEVHPIPTNTNMYTTCICCSSHMYMHPVYTASCICMWPVYTAAYVHLQKARFFTFLKLRHFVASVTSTCNLSQPVPINLYYQPCTSITHTTCTITGASTMHNTSYHHNLSHQPHQPNQIYSPRSITKTTLNQMHTITKMCITQDYSQT